MLSLFVSAFIYTFLMVFYISYLIDDKINYKDYKVWLVLLGEYIFIYINYVYISSMISIAFTLAGFGITTYLLHKNKTFYNILAGTIIYYFVCFISEIICSIIVIALVPNLTIEKINANYLGTFFVNVLIATITISSIKIPFIKKWYIKFSNILKNTKTSSYLTTIFFGEITINILYNLVYYDNDLLLKVIIELLLIFIYAIILLRMLVIKSKNKMITDRYNNALDSLKEYEKMMDLYRVNNHENKNQLLTIRNMIKEKDAIEFIDKIVDNKIKDDESIMYTTANIPEGGLRAVIYSKLLEMKENKIKFNLKADFNVRRFDFPHSNSNLVLDICKVVGIFLDNAIQASVPLERKAIINVSLTLEKINLVISVKNKYQGEIDLKKIDKIGYTTKSSGHGYGLSLAKNLIEKNRNLENIRELRNNTFIQILKIKKS